MNASPQPLHTLNTVRAAYAAFLDNAGAFAGLAVLWIALWIAYNLATPTLAALVVQAFPATELTDTEQSLEVFGQVVIEGIAVVSVCIAWHRFVILDEPLRYLFPSDIRIVLQYVRRAVLLVLLPAGLIILVLWAAFNSTDYSTERIPPYVLAQLAETLAIAALVRVQLAFPATAIGERAPTFWGSWVLTRGSTLPLIAGMLACDLPFTILSIAIDEATLAIETQTIEHYLAMSILTVVELARAAVVAAFLSCAYLHFTRADAANRPPASYFS